MTSPFVDPAGRGPKAPTLALRGVVYLAALLLGAGLLMAESQGAFANNFPVSAQLADVGDGLPVGSDVKLRGVLIGRVAGVESVPGQAEHTVRLDLKPEHAGGVPASVKARIIPTNIFGAPSVDLVAEPGDTRRLAEGATIPADTSAGTVKLQTAIDKLHDVLRAVQPAKLNTALYNISRALQGQGAEIGDTIVRLDDYLSTLNPHADVFGENLEALGTALESLDETAPALLDTVDSVLTTAGTLVEKENALVDMLGAGAKTSDTWSGFVDDNAQRLINVLYSTRPMVNVMAQQHELIPASFDGLGKGAAALRSLFDKDTKWLNVNAAVSMSPYQPYTAADCPRYPGIDGPNCGDPVPARDSGARTSAPADEPAPLNGGTVGSVGSPQELELFTNLLGDDGDGVGGLLLGPLLRGGLVVIPR